MSWTRGPLAVLAVCVLSLAGSAGCGSSSGGAPDDGASPSPVGRLLDDRDTEGRPYREVERDGAPDVGVEVQPDAGGGWDVRLTVRNFRFSPAGSAARAVAGRGLAHLYVDGRLVARLRAPEYRLPARLVPRGTHQVTARLYADDGTVWAVDGEPVETTADVTTSQPGPAGTSPPAGRRWTRAQVTGHETAARERARAHAAQPDRRTRALAAAARGPHPADAAGARPGVWAEAGGARPGVGTKAGEARPATGGEAGGARPVTGTEATDARLRSRAQVARR
ncbi:hypothetical protein ACIPM2_11880 [Streptomyces sp. NPDC086081]|uniref:hypothetical protein n=1 Tax=Streptomyces sp. NPDC086081 TaxID=3365749 RepID=UPI00382444C3